MASPQAEKGFTRLANELLDRLIAFPFSKRQYKVMLYIVRKTYGYNKKADAMSNGMIATATGLSRQHVIATITELSEMGVITVERSEVVVRGSAVKRIGVQKDYTKWLTSPETGTSPKTGLVPKRSGTSPKTGLVTSPKTGPTKDNGKDNTKDKGPITIDTYLANCREDGVKPVPPTDRVFAYADEVGVPHDFLRLCWREFVERNRDRGKKYKSWPQAFRNCVRENWYRLWWVTAEGEYQLTTNGAQAKKRDEAARRKEQAA